MKFFIKFIFILLFLPLTLFAQDHAQPESAIDIKKLEAELNSGGLVGWIHGAITDRKIFVFTYRNPTNFFDYIQFPITADDTQVWAQIEDLGRHDQVRLKGALIDNEAPIYHIVVSQLEMIKKNSSVVSDSYYEYQGLLKDVLSRDNMVARVHARGAQGQMLVIEYKDIVIPVFVKEEADQAIVQSLYRGDKVRLRYKAQRFPKSVTHLNLKTAEELGGKPAIEVLSSIVQGHDQPVTKTGSLIFFPQSPDINRNIFALQELDPDGAPIQYTLVNFESMELFQALLQKLQKVWDAHLKTAENARNKMINPKIQVRAKGTMNMVSQSQANPQILIQSLDDVEIKILP
jgi:hypothetical protein